MREHARASTGVRAVANALHRASQLSRLYCSVRLARWIVPGSTDVAAAPTKVAFAFLGSKTALARRFTRRRILAKADREGQTERMRPLFSRKAKFLAFGHSSSVRRLTRMCSLAVASVHGPVELVD